MLNWILLHISGMLDWLVVYLAVFFLVFLIQFMVNFYKGHDDTDE